MKLSHWTPGARLVALLVIVTAFFGCPEQRKEGVGETKSMAITPQKKFDVPPGADPSVPAQMGGNGFETIAADSGWQTSSYTPEQYRNIADTSATKGGAITFSLTAFPATFRLFGKEANAEVTSYLNGFVHIPIVTIDPLTLEFLPGLATHWKIGADSQTYYFRLNPNARFHDGHAVTTDDVIATHKLASDTSILDPYENASRDEYEPPVAISKYIFSIRSKTKNWKNMLYYGLNQVLPAHVLNGISGTDFLKKYQFEMFPGTGPYTIRPEDVQKGMSVTLTRIADWWMKDDPNVRGQYNFDKVKINFVSDERLRLEKFKSGENDFYVVGRALWWKEEFEGDLVKRGVMQKHRIYTDDPQGVVGIAFNTRKAPFDDPRVRLAFVHLFNREQLVEKLMFNQYELMDSYFPNSVYANPSNPKFRYDPARAEQLLTEAGYTQRNGEGILVKDGRPFSIDMPITQDFERIITPVQLDLKKAGIQLNLRVVDPVNRFDMAMERNFTLLYQQWTGVNWPNPFGNYHSSLADKHHTNNITGFKNARVDQLIDIEKTTFDQNKRIAIMREIDSILMASNHYTLMWYAPYVRIVHWNSFGHPDFFLSKTGDWKDVAQYWWSDPEKAAMVRKGKSDKSVTMETGEIDVKFWPDYNRAHPPATAPATAAK